MTTVTYSLSKLDSFCGLILVMASYLNYKMSWVSCGLLKTGQQKEVGGLIPYHVYHKLR